MGWKNVKQHYKITHLVEVTEKGFAIGSGYIPQIILVSPEGQLLVTYSGSNEDLNRYQAEIQADPAQFAALFESADKFDVLHTVYTYKDAEIIEKQCEELGWPNTTLDGETMYENMFSTNKQQVIAWAKSNADSALGHYKRALAEALLNVENLKSTVAEMETIVSQLESTYPSVPSDSATQV